MLLFLRKTMSLALNWFFDTKYVIRNVVEIIYSYYFAQFYQTSALFRAREQTLVSGRVCFYLAVSTSFLK